MAPLNDILALLVSPAVKARTEPASWLLLLSRHHSTLSNVRVAEMVCPVRDDVSGVVVIVSLVPSISK